jgi:hypothetical protein
MDDAHLKLRLHLRRQPQCFRFIGRISNENAVLALGMGQRDAPCAAFLSANDDGPLAYTLFVIHSRFLDVHDFVGLLATFRHS